MSCQRCQELSQALFEAMALIRLGHRHQEANFNHNEYQQRWQALLTRVNDLERRPPFQPEETIGN